MIFEKESNNNGIVPRPKNNVETLWVEKYRPFDLDNVIIPKRVRTLIQALLDNGISRHVLLYGSTGTGKTTIARILCANKKTLQINASEENGIETVRDVIIPFSSVTSMKGETKVVFMDEVDNLTPNASLSLQGVMEKGANTVRYIATCNFPERLSTAMKSRYGVKINFDFNGDELNEVLIQKVKRIQYICKNEGLTIEDKAIMYLIGKLNDMRDIIENLQTMYELGITNITLNDVQSNTVKKYDDFFKLILTKGVDIFTVRNYVTENYPNIYYNIIVAMGDTLCLWLSENKHKQLKIASYIYFLSHKYKTEAINKPDPLTSLMAFVSELQVHVK